jgi:hypothetical protein
MSLIFIPVSKPHTYQIYIIRLCTNIVYLSCNCMILNTNKEVIKTSVLSCHGPNKAFRVPDVELR